MLDLADIGSGRDDERKMIIAKLGALLYVYECRRYDFVKHQVGAVLQQKSSSFYRSLVCTPAEARKCLLHLL